VSKTFTEGRKNLKGKNIDIIIKGKYEFQPHFNSNCSLLSFPKPFYFVRNYK